MERAFGVLINRWGIFWRPLQCCYTRWRLIIQVTFCLHNICLRNNVATYPFSDNNPLSTESQPEIINDYYEMKCPIDPEHPENLLYEVSKRDTRRRDEMVSIIQEQNWIRPRDLRK